MTNRARLIQELREKTMASILLIKEALDASGGDVARAEQYIAEHAKEAKDGGQGAGLIVAKTHQGRIGAMLELRCGTDFVVRTDEFQQLAAELLLQVIAGVSDAPLPEQDYVRNPSCKVADLIADCASRVGEQITVRRSMRWEL
jgi:elongation factor Ts